MKGKNHIINFVRLAIMLLFVLMTTTAGAQSTASVSTYAELSAAISNASVNNIIVTANIDVPCSTSVMSTSVPDTSGSSTAQLVIKRSLTLQSQAGSKYTIKRIAVDGATTDHLKSIIAVKGNGLGTDGDNNLTQNTVTVTFKNIVIDGGADWGESEYCDRYTAATTAYGNAGRAMIDIFLGGTLNLEDGVVLQNGYTTYSINSVVNNSGSANYGGAVRVEYHANYGGGTVNVKAGAIIHDCTASGYGGALGAYNFARLNLYGGTIYNCSSGNGGAIATTYRSGSNKTKSGTVNMYGGIIRDCCATNGGAISMDGEVSNFLLGGTIENCNASTKGAAICINESGTTVNMVAYNSHLLTITNCTGGENTSTANTNGYAGVYKNESATIADYPVYHVTFQNNNTTFAVLSVAQGTSLGEAFPAAPVNASFRFVGWYNGNTQVTSTTVINGNITVTAQWDFFGSGTEADPYQIPSTAAWDFLADKVNNGNTYNQKYFQLTNNISVTTMVGASTYDGHFLYFSGIFDGDGKTLNVNLVGTTECTAAFSALDNATIKNLHITGSINTPNVRPASIAGFVNGSSTIENCWSELAISSSKENDWVDAGAFVARVNGNQSLTLTGCLFTGSITYESTAYEGGGMVGWTRQGATVTLNNCVFAPSAINITMTHINQYVFVTGLAQKNINNCYYNDVAAATSLVVDGDGGNLVPCVSVAANTWQAVAAPMRDWNSNSLAVSNVGGLTDGSYDLLRYNETAAKWENQKSGNGAEGFNILKIGHGYIYRRSTDATLTFTGLPNIEATYRDTLTATDAAGDLKGFNLVGNPYPHTISCSRAYYSLRPDGTWERHENGGTLEIGQAVLVYTTESGETLTLTSSGISGSKGTLPPLPKGLCLNSNDNDNLNDNDNVDVDFAHIEGDRIVITGTGTLKAFDIMGRELFTQEISISNSQFSISQFPHSGVYILRLDEKSQKIVIR